MRNRFDSRPLVLRQQYRATMRQTMTLGWRTQARHGLQLFCAISSAVIARNVANQEVLDTAGPGVLGQLYTAVALVAGIGVAVLGWFGRERSTRGLTRVVHIVVAACMAAAFLVPGTSAALAIAKYILFEIGFAAMLLVFGLMLGASLAPREARKVAARVGAGGVFGGLLAGAVLGGGALLVGSRALFLVAAALALLPVFWLPQPSAATPAQARAAREPERRSRRDVPALAPYGRWVAFTTLVMVAATTLIDYQYRFAAAQRFGADQMTAFFGFVVILSGAVTVLFQLGLLNRLLDRLGLFSTAMLMPTGLVLCVAAFGLAPGLASLVLLKVVDSGGNMSLQQATGSLLLAPLGPRPRSVWQGRIDGLAKRGGQALIGLFLALFPWAPARALPVILALCVVWLGAIAVTRRRYVRLLTQMLGASPSSSPELQAYDGATLRLLETELAGSSAARAAVILDLLEKAQHRAPEHVLLQLARTERGVALRVIEHLATLNDTRGLVELASSPDPEVSATSLLALADLDMKLALARSRQVLLGSDMAETLVAVAAGLLADHDEQALRLCDKLARSPSDDSRVALARALGRSGPGAPPRIAELLERLAADADSEVARTSLESLSRHLSAASTRVALSSLERRELRGAAMRSLAGMGLSVVPAVAEALRRQQRNASVAASLTWVLGRIGAPSCVTPLASTLDAPVLHVRLGAAVALSTLHRRRPMIPIPLPVIDARLVPEARYCGRMRAACEGPLPDTPSGALLARTVRRHSHASLEALFRMLSLRYPEEAMQGAFHGMTSRDRRQRQLALELLDNLLEAPVHAAIVEAVSGTGPAGNGMNATLEALAREGDWFLASLARAVMIDAGGGSRAAREAALRTGEIMAQTLVNQVLELQSLQLFSQSSAEDLAEVAGLVSASRVTKGAVLYREGEPPDHMYLVRTGRIALARGERVVDEVGPGEACGIVAILDRLPREQTATAVADCSLLAISGDDLLQLLADRPLLMHSVFRALTSSVRSHLDRLALGKRAEEWSW